MPQNDEVAILLAEAKKFNDTLKTTTCIGINVSRYGRCQKPTDRYVGSEEFAKACKEASYVTPDEASELDEWDYKASAGVDVGPQFASDDSGNETSEDTDSGSDDVGSFIESDDEGEGEDDESDGIYDDDDLSEDSYSSIEDDSSDDGENDDTNKKTKKAKRPRIYQAQVPIVDSIVQGA